MQRKFASIANSAKYGYSFDTDSWEYRSNPFLSQKMRMFETYNDGLCQHSHDWAVSEEFAIDYLYSLAVAMQSDEDLCERAGYCFGATVSTDTLKFAASLIFNPEKDKEWGKTRYFSMSLGKVTRDQDKRHDDRFKELNEYHTGSPVSILALVTHEYADGLERWQIADAVRTWSAENLKNGYMEMPAVQLKWFNSDFNVAREFRDAVECCKDAATALRSRNNSAAQVDNYRRSLERKAARTAAQPEPLQLSA